MALYSRKVLIQQQAAGLLPPWLRFLRGAVDCEDVPLNIGRELLQARPPPELPNTKPSKTDA